MSCRRFLFSGFFLVLLVLLLPGGTAARDELRGKVAWVYDGDSLQVAGVGQVRLLGIDTPEKKDSGRDRFYLRLGIPRENLRPAAERARQFTRRASRNKVVLLVPGGDRHDRYGRLLAYVFLPDGRLLNRLLLENGLAVVYRRFDFSRKEEFLSAEEEARRQGRGMWEDGEGSGVIR